jgi:hypothetical protein
VLIRSRPTVADLLCLALSVCLYSCGVVLFIQLAGFPPFQRPALNDWWFNSQ